MFAQRIDEYGKPAWIALTILAFWLFWPLGVAALIFLGMSGRMNGWRCASRGRWYVPGAEGSCWPGRASGQSGNAAFDAYRAETLRRLEEEEREFKEYLERLRRARDKEEFDRFMDERRQRPVAPQEPGPTE